MQSTKKQELSLLEAQEKKKKVSSLWFSHRMTQYLQLQYSVQADPLQTKLQTSAFVQGLKANIFICDRAIRGGPT